MKLIQETPSRLMLEARPWVLGSALIIGIVAFLALALTLWSVTAWLTLGLGLAAILLAVCFVVFVQRVIVIFDRPAAAVLIRTRSLMGQEEQTLALSDVTGAGVETSRSTSTSTDGRRSTSVTHRTVLTTRSGPVPLTSIYTSGSGAETIAQAINRWLAAPAR